MVQLFDWPFRDIRRVMPELRALGYSHIHVSPPQQSNERSGKWYGRYQPVDFATIDGPLGNEAEFRAMTAAARRYGMEIVVDVVLNHTTGVSPGSQPAPGFVVMSGDRVTREKFPQFAPEDFHRRCEIDDSRPESVRTCWLFGDLADLATETPQVRAVARDYLKRLLDLGVSGFRFDAAKHIEPEFFSVILDVAPGRLAVGEVVGGTVPDIERVFPVAGPLALFDFPLLATLRKAFAYGGDLRMLRDPAASGGALGGRAVTFVRNHDVDRGQADDGGLASASDRETFGVGWNEHEKRLDRTDVNLAYAYLFGRAAGLPYVFVDMPSLPEAQRDDRFDDPFVVAGLRFHNLCLGDEDSAGPLPEIWRIAQHDVIGWQRGTRRFVVVNKAAEPHRLGGLATSLIPGIYRDAYSGAAVRVDGHGVFADAALPARSAWMLIWVGS